jgi:hypothetical protein
MSILSNTSGKPGSARSISDVHANLVDRCEYHADLGCYECGKTLVTSLEAVREFVERVEKRATRKAKWPDIVIASWKLAMADELAAMEKANERTDD